MSENAERVLQSEMVLTPVLAQSTAPEDVIKSIERDRQRQLTYETQLKEAAIKAEREAQLLQKKIYDSSNPSPIFVAAIVITVLLIMYIIYVVFLKPCMSGDWLDHAGNEWTISHNRFTGNFRVKINGECRGVGKTLDNYVQYGDLVGVWNYHDIIYFTEGWQLQRVV